MVLQDCEPFLIVEQIEQSSSVDLIEGAGEGRVQVSILVARHIIEISDGQVLNSLHGESLT